MTSRTVLLAALLLPSAAFGAPAATPAPAPALNKTDIKFIHEAAAATAATIKLSQLELQKGTDQGAKQFARHLIDRDTKTASQLTQIAALGGGAAAPAPAAATDPKADAEAKQLDKLSGPAFDKRWLEIEARDEESRVKLFHAEEHATQNRGLYGLTSDAVPLYEQDSDTARHLLDGMKGAKKKAKAG